MPTLWLLEAINGNVALRFTEAILTFKRRPPYPPWGMPPSPNKHAIHTTHPAVRRRLARAVGHLQGVIRMIEAQKSCPEVLQQMGAVIAAVESTRKVFLEDHIRGCILDAVQSKSPDRAFEELQRVLSLLA